MPQWLRENWGRVREELLAGTYQPTPVRRQMIPKLGGGERELGIPTVLERLIQQALLQVLQPIFDPTSHRTATGSVRAAGRTMPYGVRSGASRKAGAGSSTLTSNGSSPAAEGRWSFCLRVLRGRSSFRRTVVRGA